jgi:hypothetical protein
MEVDLSQYRAVSLKTCATTTPTEALSFLEYGQRVPDNRRHQPGAKLISGQDGGHSANGEVPVQPSTREHHE